VAAPTVATQTVTTDSEAIEMRTALNAPRLLGILAIVAGAMAFGATAAQAEPGAYWLVNGDDIGESLLPAVQAEKETHVTLLTKVGASTVEILCSSTKVIGAKLHQLGQATGKIHYEGCTTKLNKNLANNCKPKSPGATSGLIETNFLDALLKSHELSPTVKDEFLELLPSAGTAFVSLELGPLCAIGNKFDIKGKVTIKDCSKIEGGLCVNEGLVDKEKHLFLEGPLSALLFDVNPATVDGSAFGFLTGEHEGMTFAGHA
jgi:hypothetical protein